MHFVWVIYILEHTCEFSMWNLRTQLSPFPRSQIGIYFLLSEGVSGLEDGGPLQMAALGFKRIFCPEISSRLAQLLELTGSKERKVVIC